MAIVFNTMRQATLKVDTKDLEDARAMLANIENGFVRAYTRALNTTVEGVRTDMVAMARDEYTFKADAVRARTAIEKASFTRLQANVKSTGQGVPLSDFLGTRQILTGLSVDIKRDTGRQQIKHAFLNEVGSGKILAFRREVIDGKRVGRYPIEALYGPHPEVVYNTPENWEKLQGQADERLKANFIDEVDGVLRQYG
jgi:hypothetical protein